MDPTERFTDTVERYRRFRPNYPEALFDWLATTSHGRRVADLGSGTGIFTRMLQSHGWDAVGVEPNAAMRQAAVDEGPAGLRYVDGSAEATGLPAACVDLVTGAQAFHWFDLDRTLPEIARIGPSGLAVAVWNVRVGDGFAAAYDEVLTEHSPAYRAVVKPDDSRAVLAHRLPGLAERRFPHGQQLDKDEILGRAWSSSYVQHGVTDRAAFDAALMRVHAAHADPEGRVWLAYDTIAAFWPIPGA